MKKHNFTAGPWCLLPFFKLRLPGLLIAFLMNCYHDAIPECRNKLKGSKVA